MAHRAVMLSFSYLAPRAAGVALPVLVALLGCESVPAPPPTAGDPSTSRFAPQEGPRTGGATRPTTSPARATGSAERPALALPQTTPVRGSVDPASLTWQQRFPRVRSARQELAPIIAQLFAQAGVSYPGHQLLIRVFKSEELLELWVQPAAGRQLQLLKTYDICARSGGLGPKRRQGDRQVPEGFYQIDRFNPASRFHLSLGLNYPNSSDRLLSDPQRPGGDIFIHGDCVTIGCVPLTDRFIKELYVIALDSHEAGRPVAVHVFPARMVGASWTALEQRAGADAELLAFWQNLRRGFDYVERHKRLPAISIDRRGRYSFR